MRHHRPTALRSLVAQVELFGWFARLRDAGIMITGLALGAPVLSFIAGFPAANFVDSSQLSILLLYVPACIHGGVQCAGHFKILVLGWSACYGTSKGEKWGPRVKHFQMCFVAGLALLAVGAFSSTLPLFAIKGRSMAAALSGILGVVYLTPQSAGGATVAGIWEKINALEAAGQPLPADLQQWKVRTTAGIWAKINALEAAGQPLPADLQQWKVGTTGLLSAALVARHKKARQAADVAAAAAPPEAPLPDDPFQRRLENARRSIKHYDYNKKFNGNIAWTAEMDAAIVAIVEASNGGAMKWKTSMVGTILQPLATPEEVKGRWIHLVAK